MQSDAHRALFLLLARNALLIAPFTILLELFLQESIIISPIKIVLPEKKFRPVKTGGSGGLAMHENYRRYQRYSVSAKALITRRDTESPETMTTQVSTISQGGMGFYAAVPLQKTTPVMVELLLGSPGMGILKGKIASISSQGNNYFVGIAFDSEIPHERFIEIFG